MLLQLLLHAAAARHGLLLGTASKRAACCKRCCKQALRLSKRCCKQASAASKRTVSSQRRCKRYCKRCCRSCCCCCCRKRVHRCHHAPDLRRYGLFSGREDNEAEGGRSSRCGGVACTATVEERKINRISACWCLLPTTSAACCRCCCCCCCCCR